MEQQIVSRLQKTLEAVPWNIAKLSVSAALSPPFALWTFRNRVFLAHATMLCHAEAGRPCERWFNPADKCSNWTHNGERGHR